MQQECGGATESQHGRRKWAEVRTGGEFRPPDSQHLRDPSSKLVVERIGEDVLDPALHEQVLATETADRVRPKTCGRARGGAEHRYLLKPQAEVEDAVWAVRRPVGTSDLLDEVS